MAVPVHRCLFLSSRVKEFCRWAVLGGRLPFLQKFVLLMLALSLVPRAFSSSRHIFQLCWGSVPVAGGECSLWERRDGALSLPWLTVLWGDCSCCVPGLCQAALSKEWALFSFSFQRGTGPAFRIDKVSTYCQGRIETVILIWHRHLFLALAEAHKAERSSGLTHSFHHLFLLLSYLIAETWVSAVWSVTCLTSNKMQEVSWWTEALPWKNPVHCAGKSESDWETPPFHVYLLGSVVTWIYRFFSWRVKSCKWGGVMLSRQDPQYLPNSPNLMFFSLFQFSLFLSGFRDRVFSYLGFLGRAWTYFCLCLSFQAPNRRVPLQDSSVQMQKTRISTNNLLLLL